MATVETTPGRVTVAVDGSRVVYVHDGALWVYDVGGEQRRVTPPGGPGPGASGYATDAYARTAVFTVAGRLFRADLTAGGLTALPTAGPATDPRPDPTGGRIGYLTAGSLYVLDNLADASGTGGTLLAGEPPPSQGGHPHVSWGGPEPEASQFGRHRGWWWAPDGRSVLAARVDRSRARTEVSLHLLELDGGWVDVHWDRETYPYLVSVCWVDHGDPLIAVLRRPQQHGLVLAVDSRTGETQVHAELADPRWVEPVPGTPCHLPDGRVLVGGELAHDGYDARCLFADGTLLTPPTLYVRRVVGRMPGTNEILVEASAGEPSEQHLFQVSTSVGAIGIDARPLTGAPGWHRAEVGGDTLVIGSESLEHPGLRWSVYSGDTHLTTLDDPGPDPDSGPDHASGSAPVAGPPAPHLARVTDRRLPTGVLYPSSHVSGRRLPVLVTVGGMSQQVRAVRADWTHRQRIADAGFAVVVVDHRGTPGVAPSFEKVVHRRLVDLALADLDDALLALAEKHPDLDLDRVGAYGTGVGGWLAALAALRRPERFACAAAEHPVLDWADPERGPGEVFAERFLGLPDAGADVYEHHALLTSVAGEAIRPLLLVVAPDQVPALSEALPDATVVPDTAALPGLAALPDATVVRPDPAVDPVAWLRDRLASAA